MKPENKARQKRQKDKARREAYKAGRVSFSRQEFAARHGIPIRTLDRYLADGKVPSFYVGRHRRIPIEAEAPVEHRPRGTKLPRVAVGEDA